MQLERALELGPTGILWSIGKVVHMHVDSACITNGSIDMKKLKPIGPLSVFLRHTWRHF
jgi:hypothetical protein